MNIQKSRLAATLTVMLMVCMMVTSMIIPASAAEIEQTFYLADSKTENWDVLLMQKICSSDYAHNGNWGSIFANEEQNILIIPVDELDGVHSCSGNCLSRLQTVDAEGTKCYVIENNGVTFDLHRGTSVNVTITVPDPSISDSGLSSVVTKELLSGGLDEVVALLPVVIPVMIGFIGLRKGISFLQSVLHSA